MDANAQIGYYLNSKIALLYKFQVVHRRKNG